MSNRNYLKGLSQTKTRRKTKNVNVLDQTVRKIKCIEKTHDYLGDGCPAEEVFEKLRLEIRSIEND